MPGVAPCTFYAGQTTYGYSPQTRRALDDMIASIQRMAARKAGLFLRLPQCKWTAIQREGTRHRFRGGAPPSGSGTDGQTQQRGVPENPRDARPMQRETRRRVQGSRQEHVGGIPLETNPMANEKRGRTDNEGVALRGTTRAWHFAVYPVISWTAGHDIGVPTNCGHCDASK